MLGMVCCFQHHHITFLDSFGQNNRIAVAVMRPLSGPYTVIIRPLYGLCSAVARPLYGIFTAIIRPIYGLYMAVIQPLYAFYTEYILSCTNITKFVQNLSRLPKSCISTLLEYRKKIKTQLGHLTVVLGVSMVTADSRSLTRGDNQYFGNHST